MSKVEVRNLKAIKELVFEIPERPGVYLLVGKNGCGKGTLLTCLHRIGYSNAFRDGLPSSDDSSKVDQYAGAAITYISDSGEVTYTRRRKRWTPSPYEHAQEILKGFGFRKTVFARADQSRLRITTDDITEGNLYKANSFVTESMIEVFEDEKYRKLKQLAKNVGRHSKDDPYLLPSESDSYYSEKRFSSGELALLRLMTELQNLEPGSLVLLDEAELALHPQSQRRLVSYLKQEAKAKKLIILVATHSTTLVANAFPRNIILLDKQDDGTVEVVHPCYPAEAMESVDVFNSVLGDYLILVEDDMAQMTWRAMCDRVLAEKRNTLSFQYDVLPVGGFKETAKLANHMRGTLPDHTTIKAVLDDDSFDNKCAPLEAIMADQPLLVHSLGFTPEPKLIDIIQLHAAELEGPWRKRFGRSLKAILSSNQYKNHDTVKRPRDRAKRQLNKIIEGLANPTYQPNQEAIRVQVVQDAVNLMPLDELATTIKEICRK